MSLVVRVMSEALENCSNSDLLKLSTLLKSALRRSCATPADDRPAKNPTRMLLMTMARV